MSKNQKFIQFRCDLGFTSQNAAAIGFDLHEQTIKALDHGTIPSVGTAIKLQDTHRQIKGYEVDIISIFKN